MVEEVVQIGNANKRKARKHLPDERLWRRVTQHFNHDDWLQAWDGEAIVAWLIQKEGLAAQFRSDPKAERALLSKVNETLAHGRKEGTYILDDTERKVRFRSKTSLEQLELAAAAWKDFFSRHGGRVRRL